MPPLPTGERAGVRGPHVHPPFHLRGRPASRARCLSRARRARAAVLSRLLPAGDPHRGACPRRRGAAAPQRHAPRVRRRRPVRGRPAPRPCRPRWSRSAATWWRASTRRRRTPRAAARPPRVPAGAWAARAPAVSRTPTRSRPITPTTCSTPRDLARGRAQGGRRLPRGSAAPAAGVRRGGRPPEPAGRAPPIGAGGEPLRAALAQGRVVPCLPAPGARHHGPDRSPDRRGALPAARDARLRRRGGARGARAPARPAARGRVRAPGARLHGAARAFNSEFSQGIENIGWDSQRGLNSRDLRAHRQAQGLSVERLAHGRRRRAPHRGVEPDRRLHRRRPAGCSGPPSAIRGCFPAPYAAGFVPHRAVPAQVTVAGPPGIEIPEDALLPEPRTGALLPVGKGKTAKARVTYRLWGSAASTTTRGSRRPTRSIPTSSPSAGAPAARPARRARSGDRGRHRDRASGPGRSAGGEGGQRGAPLQRHHLHLRGAGGRGLPQRGRAATPSWPRWRRRGAPCPGT